MYKVLFVSDNNVSLLETMLNDAAQAGYRWVHAFNSVGRNVIILSNDSPVAEAQEEKRKPGRPRKVVTEEENGLGS